MDVSVNLKVKLVGLILYLASQFNKCNVPNVLLLLLLLLFFDRDD